MALPPMCYLSQTSIVIKGGWDGIADWASRGGSHSKRNYSDRGFCQTGSLFEGDAIDVSLVGVTIRDGYTDNGDSRLSRWSGDSGL